LQDFQKFAEAIFARYGENAKTIAISPKAAGDRLTRDLANLQGSVGTLIEPIGAAFQELASVAVRALTAITDKLDDFMKKIDGFAKLAAGLGQQAATTIFGPIGGLLANIGIQRFFPRGDGGAVDPTTDIQQPSAGTGLSGFTPEFSAGSKEKTDNLEERIRLSEQALNLARADLEVQDQIDSLDRIRIKAFRDILELQFKVQNALENETNEIVRRNIEEENRLRILGRQSQLFKDLNREAQDRFNTFFKLTKAQDDAFADAQKRFNNFYKQTTSKLTDTQKLIQSIGGVISGGLTSAFQSLITGAKSLKEILADVLGQIGQLFIQFAVRQALGSINIGGVPLVPSAKGNVFARQLISVLVRRCSPKSQ
jgi:flagellar biosynthesis/type III secretory pathway chaperone